MVITALRTIGLAAGRNSDILTKIFKEEEEIAAPGQEFFKKKLKVNSKHLN